MENRIDHLRKKHTTNCNYCGKTITGLSWLKYCQPTDGKTKSSCKIKADALARAKKKAK